MYSHVWMPSTRRTRRLCWSTKKCTCRVYGRRSRHDGAATRSRKGVDVYSTLTSCSPPVTSMITTTTTTKSWRSDTLIILPGWECHTGGSRSKPTVHRCSQSGRRLWVAHQVHNHEPNGSAAVRQFQHGSGAFQIHSTISQSWTESSQISRSSVVGMTRS